MTDTTLVLPPPRVVTATVAQKDLASSLARIAGAVDSQPNHPILNGVWFRGRDVHTTDIELWFTTSVPYSSDGDGELNIVVPYKPCLKIVKAFDPRDILTLTETTVTVEKIRTDWTREKGTVHTPDGTREERTFAISCRGETVTLKTMATEDFPNLPEINWDLAATVVAAHLVSGISTVLPSVSMDVRRPVLTAACLEPYEDKGESGIAFTGTDSYRLTHLRRPAELTTAALRAYSRSVAWMGRPTQLDNPAWLVPGHFLDLVRKLKPTTSVSILIGTKPPDNPTDDRPAPPTMIRFVFDDMTMTSRLVEGEYPKYQQLLPSTYIGTVTFPTDDVLTPLKKVEAIATPNTSVKFEIDWTGTNACRIMAEEPGVGEVTAELGNAVVSREEGLDEEDREWMMIVAFNHRFFGQVLQACGRTTVMRVVSPTKPAAFSAEGSEDLHVCMPVKLSEAKQ